MIVTLTTTSTTNIMSRPYVVSDAKYYDYTRRANVTNGTVILDESFSDFKIDIAVGNNATANAYADALIDDLMAASEVTVNVNGWERRTVITDISPNFYSGEAGKVSITFQPTEQFWRKIGTAGTGDLTVDKAHKVGYIVTIPSPYSAVATIDGVEVGITTGTDVGNLTINSVDKTITNPSGGSYITRRRTDDGMFVIADGDTLTVSGVDVTPVGLRYFPPFDEV